MRHQSVSVVGFILGLALSSFAQFSPPVNVPNECPRCVRAPCPCDTTCPKLNCPNDCQTWKLDSRGCNSCECGAVICPLTRPCAAVTCGPGLTPTVITRPGSCPTCQCVQCLSNPCAAATCPVGTKPTVVNPQVGCPICECASKGNDKPGQCPARRLNQAGPCIARCGGDSGCPGTQKCCGSCPRECVTPALNLVVKPGRCPRRPPGFIGTCDVRCQGDESCPGTQKCCGGCPTKCEKPQRVTKPNRCPARFRLRVCGKGRKIHRCKTDKDCRRGRICCGNCGRRCVAANRPFNLRG